MWHGIYISVRLTSWQKLDEQNPILLKQYLSLFDQDILFFLKQVDFLDPIHSIHFLLFKFSWWSTPNFLSIGMPHHIEVFLNFFSDPSRSGNYHLTPQHYANIVVWMIQYYYPLPKDIFVRQFQFGDNNTNIQMPPIPLVGYRFNKHLRCVRDEAIYIPIDIHLSRASLCAEQLIETIRSCSPDIFPLMAHTEVRGVVIQYYSQLTSKRPNACLDYWSCAKNTGKKSGKR